LEYVELKGLSKETKVALLNKFGFNVDKEGFVVDANGKRVQDKYTNDAVTVENFDLLPDKNGNPILITDNVLSLACYLQETEDEEPSFNSAIRSALDNR